MRIAAVKCTFVFLSVELKSTSISIQIEDFCSSDVMRPGVYKHRMTSDMREMMNNHLTDQQDACIVISAQ